MMSQSVTVQFCTQTLQSVLFVHRLSQTLQSVLFVHRLCSVSGKRTSYAPITNRSEVGGMSSTGKSFRVVRACVRAVCMSSEFGVKIYGLSLSLFPFRRRKRFSLFLSPAPQSPIQLQLALSVSDIHMMNVSICEFSFFCSCKHKGHAMIAICQSDERGCSASAKLNFEHGRSVYMESCHGSVQVSAVFWICKRDLGTTQVFVFLKSTHR